MKVRKRKKENKENMHICPRTYILTSACHSFKEWVGSSAGYFLCDKYTSHREFLPKWEEDVIAKLQGSHWPLWSKQDTSGDFIDLYAIKEEIKHGIRLSIKRKITYQPQHSVAQLDTSSPSCRWWWCPTFSLLKEKFVSISYWIIVGRLYI